MGMPLSGLLSDIFLDHIENDFIVNKNNPFNNNINEWIRYVDDIFCVWDGDLFSLDGFHKYLNSLHPKLKFTVEIEQDKTLNFLDLSVTHDQTEFLTYNIYRKPTTISTTIPYDSAHPIAHKLANFRFLVNRIFNYPISNENKIKEFNYIQNLAIQNNFPKKVLNNLTNKIKQQKDPLFTKPINNQIYKPIPYNPISLQSRGIFKKFNITLAYSNRNSILNLLSNYHYKNNDKLKRNGVYSVNCTDCNAIYIGQTGRKLETRLHEHKIKSQSNINKHIVDTGHTIDFDNAALIHNCQKGYRLDLLEQLEIHKIKNNNEYSLLNDQVFYNYKPLFTYLRK
ncbi:uncharacterized protein [Onthophagus taurus]|uniref:uncharacterized protein n=1 Tax=Onthophagus taurus TaxID=166361 RepID=UPI0039BE9816